MHRIVKWGFFEKEYFEERNPLLANRKVMIYGNVTDSENEVDDCLQSSNYYGKIPEDIYEYNEFGYISKNTRLSNHKVKIYNYIYNHENKIKQIITDDGAINTNYMYGAVSGNLLCVEDDMSNFSIYYSYNDKNQLHYKKIENKSSNIIKEQWIEYDELNRESYIKTIKDTKLISEESFNYDDQNRVILTDFYDGNIQKNIYNDKNQLIETRIDNSYSITYQYNSKGFLSSMINRSLVNSDIIAIRKYIISKL